MRRAVPDAVPEQLSVHLPSSARVKRAGAETGPPSEDADPPDAVIVPAHVPAKGRRSSGDWAGALDVAKQASTPTRPITTPSRLTLHLPRPIGPGAQSARERPIVRRLGSSRWWVFCSRFEVLEVSEP